MTDETVSSLPSRFDVIQPENLAPMEILETVDTEAIILARKAKLKELWTLNDPPLGAQFDTKSLEFEPLIVQIEAETFFELLLRDRVNQAARAVTLAEGTGTDLDAIASRYPGGVPRMAGETYTLAGDDRYRRRIWLAPNVLTPHGVPESYIFWALSSDASFRDASALTVQGTGRVIIPIMLDDGSGATPVIIPPPQTAHNTWTILYTGDPTPTAAQRLAAFAYITDPKKARKGLTDMIEIMSPNITHTSYRMGVRLFPGHDKAEVIPAVCRALAALVERNRWLGSDHTQLDIRAAIAQQGVYNASITEPLGDLVVGFDGLVKVDKIEVTYLGVGE